MGTRSFATGAALAAAIALGGCGDDDPREGDAGTMGDAALGGDAAADGGCTDDTACDDGIHCNGAERCDTGECVAGTPPECDDGVDCTADACSEAARDCVHTAPDVDLDGHTDAACGGDDCDDADPARFPGNAEVCDPSRSDEDCDSATFGDRDADGDGAIDATCCNDAAGGGASCGSDCDDTVRSVHPGAGELCDERDNDCDGMIDEGGTRSFYRDADGDGYGLDADTVTGMCIPSGYAATGGDCDDADPRANPGNPEVCNSEDDDCDGLVDDSAMPVPWYVDMDGDLYGDDSLPSVDSCVPVTGRSFVGGDCDDADAARAPGRAEVCDLRDNDCDALVDEGALRAFYRDADGDGFGDPASTPATSCTAASGYVDDARDCDDSVAARNPAAPEVCDSLDNDCDALVDEGATTTFYRDADGDSFGDPTMPAAACRLPSGYASAPSDCNDADAGIRPTATEACDGLDNDCDGRVDESGVSIFYEDRDADGFGVAGSALPSTSCTPPAGYASRAGDCNDAAASTYPGAPERCNRIDDDCSSGGGADAAEDRDGDGHASATVACTGGFPRDDCDDAAAAVFPGAPETCDRVDGDCSGDAGGEDADGDGHARSGASCTGGFPRDDCDDSMVTIYAGAPEICDRVDSDCSGDAGGEDADGDGHARSGASCTGGLPRDDCDDAVATVYPGAPETCDRIDSDCSSGGGVETGEDADGDAHAAPGAACTGGFPRDDCNDSIASVHPTAPEACDGFDSDCSSGGAPVAGEDDDGDRHAPPAAACSGGFPRDDCDDTAATTHLGAPELCNRVDDDCSAGGGVETAEDADTDAHAPSGAACTGGSLPRDDCDDANAAVHPGATEACDRIDSDCSAGGGAEAAEDADSDGHAGLTAACIGGALPRDDCDDGAPSVYAGAPELCDRLDSDCSGGGGADAAEDADGDGHAALAAACSGGFPRDDCDDGVATIYAGAPERCDRRDSDCSSGGGAEPGEDGDADMHAPLAAACSGGYPRDDCDDASATVYPSAPETCDRIDSDCSSGGGTDATEDADGDLHAPTGASCTGGFPRDDCNDAEATVYAGAPEVCDRLDSNCSSGGGIDAAEDSDSDGHAPTLGAPCAGGPLPRDDCQDANPSTYTGATEICDRLDNDCAIGGGTEVGEDADGDAFSAPTAMCTGGPLPKTDCDDANASAYPGAPPVAPRLLSPHNGWRTGSVRAPASFNTRRPDFRWVATGGDCAGGQSYHVQADDSCAVPGFAGCAFSTPEVDGTGIAATSLRPAADLPVSLVAPVGQRYYWRVRSCQGASCSGWSAVWYVDVGRVGTVDLDGNGYEDLVVGARLEDGPEIDEGQAYVYYGGPTGLPVAPSLVLDNPDDQASGQFGFSTASGDFDGDGYADLAVGAHLQDFGAMNEGNVFVYRGSATGIAAVPELRIDHPVGQASAQFGATLASVGDVDADGFADLMVGANLADAPTVNEGNAFLYRGSLTGLPAAPSSTHDNPGVTGIGSAEFGSGIGAAGDVNLDGFADVCVGAPFQDAPQIDEGNAFVFHGSASGLGAAPSRTLDNPTVTGGGGFGIRCSGGDLDADGYADVVIGAYLQNDPETDEGALFVYYGGATGTPATPGLSIDSPADVANARFGVGLSAAGDFQEDGYDDIAAGAYEHPQGATTRNGRVYVFYGSRNRVSATPSVTLVNPQLEQGQYGWTVIGRSDVTGDGRRDLVVGARINNGTQIDQGAVYVYAGSATGIAPPATLSIPNPFPQNAAEFGVSIASGP